MVLLSGRTGSGKSYTGLELATEVSILISQKKGGVPEDYFTLNNVAIMTKQEVKRVFENMGQKYGIFILDDIGTSYNSRKFQSEDNQIINDIIMTFRPNNNVLMLSVPMGSLIDKVGRELVHYIMDMQSPQFDRNLTVAKISEVRMRHNGKPIFPFLQDEHGRKFRLHYFSKPSKKICDAYDKKRDEMYNIMLKDRMERWLKEDDSKDKEQVKKTLKKEKYDNFHRDWEAGRYGDDITLKEACKQNGIPYESLLSSRTNNK